MPVEVPRKSLKPTAPASHMPSISSRLSSVRRAKNRMFTPQRSAAAAIRSSRRWRVEVTGTTLGMSSTPVTPPQMAAREPVVKSSL